jgi:tetratricopeptide (TPR) repeat protein
VIALALASVLALAAGGPDSYDDLVSRAVAAGREGRLEEAARGLEEAIALDGSRPEARVERGGLFFLEKRYEDAARELRGALRLREDAYARDLLASSLYLAGREDEALGEWNALGKPLVSRVEITGMVHVLDRVARREVPLAEGDVLTLGRVREARLRLREVGVFDRATVRVAPQPDGKAGLDVALLERHGLFASPLDALVRLGTNALNHLVRARYYDVAGTGISVGAQYRWEANRPDTSVLLTWPRPLGLDANLRFSAFRGRQLYEIDEPLDARSRGLSLGLRRVIRSRTVADVSLRALDRTFSRPDPLAPPGKILGPEIGIEHHLLDARRQRLEVAGRFLATGSDVRYQRAFIGMTYHAFLSPPDGSLIDRSVFAARGQWGYGSQGTPIDQMFAVGGSAEMEFPLRAHPQAVHGALGETPLARSLWLANLEWRRRLVRKSLVQVGVVLFSDSALLRRTTTGDLDHSLFDVGMGIRVGIGGGSIVRLDYGHGLSDGKRAIFIGLGEIF